MSAIVDLALIIVHCLQLRFSLLWTNQKKTMVQDSKLAISIGSLFAGYSSVYKEVRHAGWWSFW
ncbi:hypothetical protein C5167_003268 [Papaver somniferum]|uniref:Uncharacterized protein n=1 Tax=Papaver somniferum TaxID=3469 RepID=A0A4Y7L210_PAPSO|nr:hypothetical protein C5167_003268 [Papaver somniferum]